MGNFPAFHRWSEWNGKYRDDMRDYLKGGISRTSAALQRISGSPDIYDPKIRGTHASVNFLTCHDGFTLYDLYAYNQKHNEANGWNNTDGADDNRSWNCGAEGDTDDPDVLALRMRMIRNACAVLLCSRGTPMFFAGDEFCNTQFGNNNPYCQDNEISWLDWSLLEKHRDIFDFFRYMIRFRRSHPVLRGTAGKSCCGLPDISFHAGEPWQTPRDDGDGVSGILFAGHDAAEGRDDIVYLGINVHWEARTPDAPAASGRPPLAHRRQHRRCGPCLLRGAAPCAAGADTADRRAVRHHPDRKAGCRITTKRVSQNSAIPFLLSHRSPFIGLYLSLTARSISSFSGITLSAPFRVVMMDAPALAKVSISFKFSSVRFSRPCSRM